MEKNYNVTEQDKAFMREAIRLANESCENGGGPFGAVIVKDGEIVAGASNSVVYTSCEPCPLCLSAFYWAHIKKIYYGNSKKDAADIDFADDFIYTELAKPYHLRNIPMIRILSDEAISTFKKWTAKSDKTEY